MIPGDGTAFSIVTTPLEFTVAADALGASTSYSIGVSEWLDVTPYSFIKLNDKSGSYVNVFDSKADVKILFALFTIIVNSKSTAAL